jgi:hypothetical protein
MFTALKRKGNKKGKGKRQQPKFVYLFLVVSTVANEDQRVSPFQ